MQIKHKVSGEITEALQLMEGGGLPFEDEVKERGFHYEALDISNSNGRFILHAGLTQPIYWGDWVVKVSGGFSVMKDGELYDRFVFIPCADVKAIVTNYLEDHGYDGLYASGECGCEIADMAPCGSDAFLYCQPGYKTNEAPNDESEFAFMMGPDKPTKEALEA